MFIDLSTEERSRGLLCVDECSFRQISVFRSSERFKLPTAAVYANRRDAQLGGKFERTIVSSFLAIESQTDDVQNYKKFIR